MSPSISECSVSVKIKVKSLESLDKIAKKADLSRHKLMHNVLQASVEELEAFQRIGFFKVGLLARDVIETFQKISGLGRRKDLNEKAVPIHLSQEWLDRIDTLASKADLSRHQLMKNLIEVGAEELDSLCGRAAYPIAKGILQVRNAITRICNNGETAISAVQAEMHK